MEITTARYINVNGSLLDLSQPRVMGILNVTPDSFYAGSRTQTEVEIARRVKQIVFSGPYATVPSLPWQRHCRHWDGKRERPLLT